MQGQGLASSGAGPGNDIREHEAELYRFALAMLEKPAWARQAARELDRKLRDEGARRQLGGETFRLDLLRAMHQRIGDILDRVRDERDAAASERRSVRGMGPRARYLRPRGDAVPESIPGHAENALAALDDEQRAVAVLRIFLRLSTPDITHVLGRTESDVEELWRTARESLLKQLSQADSSIQDPETFFSRVRLPKPEGPLFSRGGSSGSSTSQAPARPGLVTPRPMEAAPAQMVTRRLMAVWQRTRVFLYLLGALLGLALVLVIGFFVYGRVTAGALEDDLEALRNSGEPVSLQDIRLPQIEVEENAYPEYRRAAQAFDDLRKEEKDLLQEILTTAEAGGHAPASRLEEAREVLKRLKPGIDLLEAASERSGYALSSPPDGWSAERIRYLRNLDRAALVLTARIVIQLQAQDPAPPTTELTALIRLGIHLHNEPTIAGQLLRVTQLRRAILALQMAYARFYFSRSRLDAMADRIDLTASARSIVRALQVERCRVLDRMLPSLRGETAIDTRFPTPGLFSAPSRRKDVAYFIRGVKRLVGDTRELPEEPPSPPQDRSHPNYAHWSGPLLDSMADARNRMMRGLAYEAVLLAALRLRVTMLETGLYPGGLGDLEGGSVPDPFKSGPLEYRPADGGFVVYSVGPDRKDDGGDPHSDLPFRSTK